MTANLPADLESFVQAEVESGRFASKDQLIEVGLRLLLERREELHAMVQVAVDQVERGEVEPFDPTAEYEELKRSRMLDCTPDAIVQASHAFGNS